MQNCAGCKNSFKIKDGLQCLTCHLWYDTICANIPDKRFRTMPFDNKRSWRCPACLIKQPKVDNTNTPVRLSNSSSPPDLENLNSTGNANVTLRNKRYQHNRSPEEKSDVALTDLTINTLREMIRKEIAQAFQESMKNSVSEQLSKINDIVTSFQQSLSFFNDMYEEMKTDIKEKTTKILEIEKENNMLKTSISDISRRMNLMEQHARSNNIELQCVPEHRSENLVNTVLQLSRVIHCDVKDSEILHCTRVAKRDTKSNRPRSILIKFNSPRTRDSFLAASIKFNKTNPKDKLSSSHLGIGADNPVPIYVVEHLSMENKAIHAAARIRSKELGYKFTWVRNGRIFMKKDELSEAILINNIDKLKTLT
ncbi:hypothetical protein O3G_MSEX000512 [Manduca sexta]|nr:hypothetical protein O3G_MSEX000512 [Manduca sexta]